VSRSTAAALRFVVTMGIVNLFADLTYTGRARRERGADSLGIDVRVLEDARGIDLLARSSRRVKRAAIAGVIRLVPREMGPNVGRAAESRNGRLRSLFNQPF